MTVDPVKLMLEVIRENSPKSIWTDSPLESFRSVANTNRGDIGEEFIVRYLAAAGLEAAKSSNRVQEWDIKIGSDKLELKTASEDSNGSFQFNHIRLDRSYNVLLCLAVRPDDILFGAWRKGDVAEGKAGTLVRMAEGQSITFKLTRRTEHLQRIYALPEWIRQHVVFK